MGLLAMLVNWYKSYKLLERAPFWIVIKIIDSFPSMLEWHCLYILGSMKVRIWQINKRLKICLNEECLHHRTNYVEQISKFIFFWLCVLIMSHTRFRMNLHSVVAWMSQRTPCSKKARYLKMQRDSNPQPVVWARCPAVTLYICNAGH